MPTLCYYGIPGLETLCSAAFDIVVIPRALRPAIVTYQSRRIGISGECKHFLPKVTNIIVMHVPGVQTQVRGKVTALGDLNLLNSAINVFPPSVPQLYDYVSLETTEHASKLTLRRRPPRNTFQTLRSWTLPPISLPRIPTRVCQVPSRYETRQGSTCLNESMELVPDAAGQK